MASGELECWSLSAKVVGEIYAHLVGITCQRIDDELDLKREGRVSKTDKQSNAYSHLHDVRTQRRAECQYRIFRDTNHVCSLTV